MTHTSIKIFGMGLLAAVSVSCSGLETENRESTYLARVESNYLTLDEARNQINSFAIDQDSIGALEKYRQQWIQRQLMLKEADNLQLTRQPEIRERLQQAREEILLNGLKDAINAQYKKQADISDEEALTYYEQNQEKLVLNERYVQFRLIEHANFDTVQTARQYLRRDSSWTMVARSFSSGAEQKIEMSNQYWPVSSLFNDDSRMKRYASTLDSSQISPVQRFEGMYRFIQLTDVRSQGEEAEPEWFIHELKQWLTREKQRKYYNSYVKNLYLNAKENNEIELFNVNRTNTNQNSDSIDTFQANE